MDELEPYDPFVLPDEIELRNEVKRPKWWYAQQLRMAGASWIHIAEALGYASDKSAEETVKQHRRTVDKDDVETLVDLELERLDALQLLAWRAAQGGSLRAIDTVLSVMNMRSKYLPLQQKEDQSGNTHNTAIFIGGDEAEYKDALRHAREQAMKKIVNP